MPLGTFTVEATVPTGYEATTVLSKTVTISSGIAGNVNFGMYQKTYKRSGLASAMSKRYCRSGAYNCPYAS